ncbi:phosphoglycolate phosphatase [Alphaproteobacteria bacterium 46_93_T64]|nr:phosphoglycolate phosphatase [Alphaproteobacteria bacterium 46_93_T64]
MIPMRLLFDLDGTLLDTAPDLHGALNFCLKSVGRSTVSLESVKHMVGQGARVLLEKGLTATGGMTSDEEIDRLFDLFLEYYADHLSDNSVPYPGVISALEQLHAQGFQMGICTNKPYKLAEQIAKDFDLNRLLPIITGGDSFEIRKPDPDHLLKTLDLFEDQSLPALMIGDSCNDINAATAAGLKSIAVSFGYTDIPPRELGANIVIDHFDELIGAIKQISE